jgi:low molecular weight protein-tyrosine phosphatase
MREVLFLCTGNYYRSRYAEALFNHEAARRGLRWRAFSRGLATQLAPPKGLSPHATRRLVERGLSLQLTPPDPVQVGEEDFGRAARIVALKETEHRPLLTMLHPRWAKRVEFWEIGDLDCAPPAVALAGIEAHVEALLEELELAQAGDGG